MNVIVRPRGGGKTTDLVRFMLEPGNEDVTFVAPTHAQADVGFRAFIREGGSPELKHRFQPAWWLENRDMRGRRPRIVIDEADGVLGSLINAQIEVITLSERRELP